MTTFSSERYLSGEAGSVQNVSALKIADLSTSNDSEFGLQTPTPLTFGIVGWRNRRGPDWMQANPDIMTEKALGPKEIDGRLLFGMHYTMQDKGATHEFWFDPARGYLPVRITRALAGKEKQGTQVRVLAARDCGNGRWFPEHVMIITPKSDGTGVRLLEMKVLELETENRPNPEDFAINIPGDTYVKWHNGSPGLIKLKQSEVVHATDIPELFEKVRRSTSEPLADTGLTHRRPWSWKTWTAVGIGAVLILVGIVWTMRRGRGAPAVNRGA